MSDPVTPRSNARRATTGHRSGGRSGTALVIVAAFIVSTVLQNVTQSQHHTLVANTGSEAKVSNLNSFSLALLLGGLRGPLVMMLWTSSESQKQDKDLEDFDSKIELIRLLQPEFDSVHIFQMWNKAYNISVQMANKANKYATIVDALEYGYKIEQAHPLDINIEAQIGQLFFDKLGNSQEQQYYVDRVRRETFPDIRVQVPVEQLTALETGLAKAGLEPARRSTIVGQAKRSGTVVVDKVTADVLRRALIGPGVKFEEAQTKVYSETGRRVRLDPILDLDGRLTTAAAGPPGSSPESLESPIFSYLQEFGPYPYGVSPMGIGLAYFKRAQILKDKLHQKHLQVSDLVVDNRPAINALNWSENEWGAGRRQEMIALGKEIPPSNNYADEREKTEEPTAPVAPDAAVADPAAAREAIYRYELTVRIGKAALVEFARHTRNYPSAEGKFRNFRQEIDGTKSICTADAAYLNAMLLPASDPARAGFLATAASEYRRAMIVFEAASLEHNTPLGLLTEISAKQGRKDMAPEDYVAELFKAADEGRKLHPTDLSALDAINVNVNAYLDAHRNDDVHASERSEAKRYVTRAFTRLQELHAAPQVPMSK